MKYRVVGYVLVMVGVLSACQPAPDRPSGPTAGSPSGGAAERVSLSAGGAPTPGVPATTPSAVRAGGSQSASTGAGVDLTHLPLGDNRIASAPQAGWIWPCRAGNGGRGAQATGPWFNGDGTYDSTAKAVVDGAVSWPHAFAVTVTGDQRILTTNDLPDHPTGIYPIDPRDDVYAYDRNPSHISEQSMRVSLPAMPTVMAQARCTPGAVGILLSGAVLFNALDAEGRDAVAHETQDACHGHPQNSGVYHYHSMTSCIPDATDSDGHSALLGYGLDGFGLYGSHGEGGVTLASAQLDDCHGHTHPITWDGAPVTMYHYHATVDFPYTIGCMRGSYDMAAMAMISGAPGQQQPGQQPPGQQSGGPPPTNGQQGAPPDLAAAAATLGVTEEALRAALGPPPPDLAAAAATLGVTEQALRAALGRP